MKSQVHSLEAPARWMLLEMLASEREGELALHVGERPERAQAAISLCTLHLSRWISRKHVVFTDYGRHVAESLATRLIARDPDLLC